MEQKGSREYIGSDGALEPLVVELDPSPLTFEQGIAQNSARRTSLTNSAYWAIRFQAL